MTVMTAPATRTDERIGAPAADPAAPVLAWLRRGRFEDAMPRLAAGIGAA